ncbi:RadC family protein [Wenzhouxiangella marina]|uniref:DNA repair protein RadC n=1 Tax=Wenzhouxiangella marina TaxID=1579979 RepID=A0A0K0XSA9_9GAMM|nr:DNA repair protein RadC [Wenzhouxiangella marina]AKS40507.1 DNA repair protein RadC [Wenzhouxiangella marina]MBB6088171.1 DNA repair protein RadC [Wenzhouxiangella marina]
MRIADWPQTERPRERLLEHGASALSEAELLAILLRTGHRGRSALDLARQLLGHFGGLRQLLDCDQDALCQQPGMGPAKFAQLHAAVELARRHLREHLCRGTALTSPQATREYLRAALRDRPHEVFCSLMMDTRHRVIAFEELFTGTIDAAHVHPRVVVERALARRAAALIVAHNHPSGVAEPSQADLAITRRLRDALALVDIRLLDHFIVGDREVVSLAERGLV